MEDKDPALGLPWERSSYGRRGRGHPFHPCRHNLPQSPTDGPGSPSFGSVEKLIYKRVLRENGP